MVCDNPPSQDASTHQIWDSYLKYYKIYALDAIFLKRWSMVKVTVTFKWYVSLRHLKMHPHTKLEILTSNLGPSIPGLVTAIQVNVYIGVQIVKHCYATMNSAKFHLNPTYGLRGDFA